MKGERLTVRDMVEDDLPLCLRIIESVEPYLLPLAEEEVAGGFRDRPREQSFIVAELDGHVVGLLGHLRDIWGVPDIWWLNWLYVDPSKRRRGVASRLLDETEQRLRRAGCRKVYLDVGNEDEHTEAIAMYRNTGFTLEGNLTDYWRPGEDFLVFGKPLTGE